MANIDITKPLLECLKLALFNKALLILLVPESIRFYL